jgi:hypothetical protein
MMNIKHIFFDFMFCTIITVEGLLHADIGFPSREAV